uniref:Uncharacterized protein n=1 Tax=Leersia perrieri TaxID=77586 RepID=A0A0D9Y054_9ORYZ
MELIDELKASRPQELMNNRYTNNEIEVLVRIGVYWTLMHGVQWYGNATCSGTIKANFGAPPAIFTTRRVTDDEQAKHQAMPMTSHVHYAAMSSKLDLAFDMLVSMNRRWENRDQYMAHEEKPKTKDGLLIKAKKRDGILGAAPPTSRDVVLSLPTKTPPVLVSPKGPPLLPLPTSNTFAATITCEFKVEVDFVVSLQTERVAKEGDTKQEAAAVTAMESLAIAPAPQLFSSLTILAEQEYLDHEPGLGSSSDATLVLIGGEGVNCELG